MRLCFFEADKNVDDGVADGEDVELHRHIVACEILTEWYDFRMQNLKEAIAGARQKRIAIGHFNISDSNQMRALALASRETSLPVIVGLSEGEREFFRLSHARKLVDVYRAEGTDMYLNADHTYGMDKAKAAIDAGVDSIVVDGAKLPLAENIALVKQVLAYARASGREVVIEVELGYIGQSSKLHDELPEGVSLENLTSVADAMEFVSESGADCFAPAVGNIHGMLKNATEPKLHADRVAEISKATNVPLVLHGASGNTQADIVACIKAGVAVVHINTELRVLYRDSLKSAVASDEVAPYRFLSPAVETMKSYIAGKLRAFAGQ